MHKGFRVRESQLTIKHLSMKKLKVILNAIAITVAIGGAFATHYYMNDARPQYIPVNNTFEPAGDYGIDYNCVDSPEVCTYYQLDSVARPEEYLPYRKGKYVSSGKRLAGQ